MLRLLFILLYFKISSGETSTKRYDRHKVFRVIPTTQHELEQASKFEKYLETMEVDIWKTCSETKGFLDFQLSPDMTFVLDDLDLEYEVLINNVQDLIDEAESPVKTKRDADQHYFDYGEYHTIEEIEGWMNSLLLKFENIIDSFHLATSFEGRRLNGLKISVDPHPDKPGIWIQAGLHAREWIAPATVIYITNQVLEEYMKDGNITAVLNTFDIYIVPLVNIDGYVYSWTYDRLWRKNRSNHTDHRCIGVDLNRNWDIKWCEQPGSSGHPCSNVYCGSSPFSESVVMGIADYIKNSTNNIVAFFDFHSYGNMWLSPWGHTKTRPLDFQKQTNASAAAIGDIRSIYGTNATYGTVASTLYLTTGTSSDWAYGVANITFSVIVELRDNGTYGFLLPQDQIIPTGKETLQGLLAYIHYVNNTLNSTYMYNISSYKATTVRVELHSVSTESTVETLHAETHYETTDSVLSSGSHLISSQISYVPSWFWVKCCMHIYVWIEYMLPHLNM